jgi:hypothetical protein
MFEQGQLPDLKVRPSSRFLRPCLAGLIIGILPLRLPDEPLLAVESLLLLTLLSILVLLMSRLPATGRRPMASRRTGPTSTL